jgi:dTDP-4-amino-4,6-dideoxygalactose transaminase/intein/homing endonuclease
VRIDGKIKVLTIKEIHTIFREGRHSSFEVLSHGNGIKEVDADNLSAHEIRRKMNKYLGVNYRWSAVKNVLFKGRQAVKTITQNFGQTCVTGDHRLMFMGKIGLKEKYARMIDARRDVFVNLLLTDNKKEKVFDLGKCLDGYCQANGRIKHDKHWVWFDYKRKSWRGKLAILPKVKRFYRASDLEKLCAWFGLYCSEGNCGHEVRFSSTNIQEIRRVSRYIRDISNLKAVRISAQDGRKSRRVIRGRGFNGKKAVFSANLGHELFCVLFGELGGKGSFNKRVPNFVFDLAPRYMKIFYDYLVEGAGCRKSANETDFAVTTASLKLASGINLLNNLLYKRFSRYILAKNKYYDISPVKSMYAIKRKICKTKKRVAEVYDIVVENTATFVDACGNVLLHNCDSLGSKYNYQGHWQYTGTFGDLATSSFYPPHHLSCSKTTCIPYLDENGRWKMDHVADVYKQYADKPEKIKILSFDAKNRVKWVSPAEILRHKLGPKKMVKIICQHGRSVEVTEDHSVFVLDQVSAKIMPKPAGEISKRDYVVATNDIPNPREIKYINILDFFREKDAYVTGFSSSNLKNVKNADNRWQYKIRNSLPIRYLSAYDLGKDRICVGISQSNKIPARIPINDKLCRLIGYFMAEGSYQNGILLSFHKQEIELIDDVREIAKTLFNLPVVVRIKGNAAVIKIQSKNLEIVFSEVFQIKRGARRKRIPWFIYHCNEKQIKSFVYGYTKGDGSIRHRPMHNHVIDVTSVSAALLNDFQYLLSRIGISASFYRRNKGQKKKIGGRNTISRDNYTLSFSGYVYKGRSIAKKNIKERNNFALQIPLLDIFRKYISVAKGQKIISRRRLGQYLTANRELSLLVGGDLGFYKVKSVRVMRSSSNDYVYDFSVPGQENFYGGFLGLFLHNTMGEGGAVYTNDAQLKKIVESFRDWGRDCWCPSGCDNTCGKRFDWQLGELPRGYDHKYIYSHFGYNLKALDLQAAIGCAQLEKLPGFIAARRKNWQVLREGLAGLADKFVLPEPTPNSDPSWFGFLLTVRPGAGVARDAIVQFLEEKGIQTRMLFAGNLIRHPCFDEMRKNKTGYRVVGDLKNTDMIMENTFWVGVYPGLTAPMLEFVIDAFKKFFA